ncbi:hypothetical protein VTO42DRAFT_7162 [Malbranchea cinnamomea]
MSPNDIQNPPAIGFVESGFGIWQNLFGTVNMYFGSAATSKSCAEDDYALTITQGDAGWMDRIELLTLVSSARLNPANHTVILDAAVVPVTGDFVCTGPKEILQAQTSDNTVVHVKVDEEEIKTWKQALPAYIERCRTWEHRPGYDFLGRLKNWKFPTKHAVRAAISPCFPVPLVEDFFSAAALAGIQEGPGPRRPTGTLVKSSWGCWKCGKTVLEAAVTQVRACPDCQQSKYCSRSCQRSVARAHKKVCKK